MWYPQLRQCLRGLHRIKIPRIVANTRALLKPLTILIIFSLRLQNRGAHALLRNTCSITRLIGSSKINVVPAESSAELDCRLLPDQDPEQFLTQLRQIINDEQIVIEKIMGFTPANSRTDTPLFAL